jgi:hypothetical protein
VPGSLVGACPQSRAQTGAGYDRGRIIGRIAAIASIIFLPTTPASAASPQESRRRQRAAVPKAASAATWRIAWQQCEKAAIVSGCLAGVYARPTAPLAAAMSPDGTCGGRYGRFLRRAGLDRSQVTFGRNAVAGSTMTIWIDAWGRLTHAPLSRAAVVDHVIGAAIVTPAALALVLCAVGLAASLVLDRHRLARWEADWLAVEPQWTRRR